MFTINEYIESLKNDKNTLVANLTTKGITGLTGGETFTELAPKVLDITSVNNQSKSASITANGNYTYSPDTGYTGLSNMYVNVNVEPDASMYFNSSISGSTGSDLSESGVAKMLKSIPSNTSVSGTTLRGAFAYYGGTTIPLIDTSNVTNMSRMFHSSNIVTIPIINCSRVTDMTQMFGNCSNLTTLPLINTGNCNNMSYMFTSCTSLTDVASINTENCTNMQGMFAGCDHLITIPTFNTSKVTIMNAMFQNCSRLTEIPQFNTGICTNLNDFVYNCASLTTFPLLDTAKMQRMNNMVNGCPNLTTQSLDNILQMCINANSTYALTKTLFSLGFKSTYYPASTIQALPHYQDFLDAGWTIGY